MARAAEKSAERENAEVEDKVEAEQDQGFRGVKVDQTPNENYTVAGVTSGKPTPENGK